MKTGLPIVREGGDGLRVDRRVALKWAVAGILSAGSGCATAGTQSRSRLFFTSRGRTCMIHADGSGMRTLELSRPGQVTWQPCGFFPDGRILMLSMEARRDGPGKPFDQYYHQTPTHVWAYDLERGRLEELATRDRLAPFYAPQLLLRDGRILMQVIRSRPGQILNMRLDGSDAREFTGTEEGLPYGMSLSPDGRRVAFHLAGPKGYQIWTSDTEGRNRTLVDAGPDHLFFGPVWSPDGDWLAYQGCTYRSDPGHDWSDVIVARPDGRDRRAMTTGQSMWFAATYGSPGNRGGGSNGVTWTRDGRLLFPRRMPGSRVPWEYQAQRPDTDHFNREFRPDAARGGTEMCRLDPRTRVVEVLCPGKVGVWDFRCCESPDGRWIAFCRAGTGEVPALWIQDVRSGHARMLTRGLEDQGVDHPRWG